MTTGQVNDDADRAVGALLGLACGDAVGTTLEFERARHVRARSTTWSAAGRSGCGRASGPTTRRWRCASPSRCSTGAPSTSTTSCAATCCGATTGYLSSNGTLLRHREHGERPAQPVPVRRASPSTRRPNQESAANGSLMRLAPVPIRWHVDVEAAEPWPPSPADPRMPASARSMRAGSWARWWRR